MGQKDPSDRIPPRRQPQLDVAVVREQQGLRRHAGRGHQGPRVPEEEAVARLGRPRSRSSVRRRTRASRSHSARPGVVIGKKGEDIENAASAELRKMMGGDVGTQHRGDPQARDRRAADRRLDRPAAREADHVPPRDEARDAERDAPGRAGHQGHERRPAERLEIARSEWYREGRVPLHTLRADIDYGFSEAQDDLRRHRHQGLGLQGRHAGRNAPAQRRHAGPERESAVRAPDNRDAKPGARPAASSADAQARRGRRSRAGHRAAAKDEPQGASSAFASGGQDRCAGRQEGRRQDGE